MNNIYIVGSGMVGVSCALNLLEKNYQVTLIERNETTQETSYGNAGVIARSSAFLINNKKLLPNLKHYLFNKHPAVRLDYPYLIRNCVWALRFLQESLVSRSENNIKNLDSLIRVSLDEHKKWLEKSKQMFRLRETGWLKLYRTEAAMASNDYEKAVYDELNVHYEMLDPRQLADLEPALAPIYRGAMHIQDAASIDNPGELVEAYKRLFIESGGQIIQDDIVSVEDNTSSECEQKLTLIGRKQRYTADQVVIAAGPWSNELMKNISKPLPMGFERGYHEHYEIPQEGATLTRPIYDVEKAFVITPTALGYRLSSGSELKDKTADPSPTQLNAIYSSAKEALMMGDAVQKPCWKGNRPTLPDSLPAIGGCPGHKHVWLAFGHQHVGFSTGPATGRLLAELIAGEPTYIDGKPFDPARFFNEA